MNDDFAPVIEQHILVNGAVVFDGEVVAVRNLHAVENLDVLADVLEDVFGQHGTHAKAQPVIQAGGRAVKHHPEPDQGFALGVFLRVHVAIVFRLQRRVARIETVNQRLLGQRDIRARRGPGPSQVQLVQCVAHYDAAVLDVTVGKLLFQLLDPLQELFFGRGLRQHIAIVVTRHKSLDLQNYRTSMI